jgi:hypothetical protein
MSIKRVLASVVVFAAGALLLAGRASAQFSGQVNVSNAIEGTNSPVGVSAARCGNSVAVGFGDSEKGNNTSFGGYAVSSNGGKTFHDFGVLPISSADSGFGPDAVGFGSSSSLSCGSAAIFYYAAPYVSSNAPCFGFPICSAISVSKSLDGGANWALPVMVDRASDDNHALMNPSIAVDPTSPQRIYIGYIYYNSTTPLDFGFPECTDPTGIWEIRVAHSADGGSTWATKIIDHVCANSIYPDPMLGPPNVVVSPGGKVYVAYEFIANVNPPLPNEIRFARSLDQGKTFSSPSKVSSQAINNALPRLAVDRTNSRNRGSIYLTWSGAPIGTYTDVLVSDSVNFGVSFSFPRPISPAPAAGTGRFQANPVVAVDNDGLVAACFYETPHNQPTSSSVYSYNCAGSSNHGASWQQQRIAASVPVGFDALTADFLLHNDGFFSAYEISSNGTRSVVGRSGDAN